MAGFVAYLKPEHSDGPPEILLEAPTLEAARVLLPDTVRSQYFLQALPPAKARAMLRRFAPVWQK